MEWECRDINSCLHCPFPDCIQPIEFKYPAKRKRVTYKTRVEAVNIETGESLYFKSVKAAARGLNVTYERMRSRMAKGVDCNGWNVRKVKVNA